MRVASSVPGAVEAIGFGRAQVVTQLLAHGIWLVDGIELTMVTALNHSISRSLSLNQGEMAALASVVFVGIACGSSLSGYCGDTVGRRAPILLCYGLVVTLALCCSLAWSFSLLVLLRLLLGVAMGVGMPASLALVSEMSPPSWRISLMGVRGVMFSLGAILAILVIVADDADLQDLRWRRAFAISALPPAVLGSAAALFLRESPLFLAAAARKADAMEVLRWMRDQNGCDVDLSELSTKAWLPQNGAASAAADEPQRYSFLDIFSGRLLCSTLALALINFSLNLAEYGIAYAEPRVLQHTSASLPAGLQLLIKYSINVPVRIGVTLLANLLGRQVALFAALVGFNAGGLLLFAWTGGLSHLSALLGLLYYCGQLLPLVGLALGNLVYFQLSVDVYPTRLAATGCAFGVAVGRIGAISAPFIFEAMRSWQHFYHLMAIGCLLSAFCGCLISGLEPSSSDAKAADWDPDSEAAALLKKS